MDQISVLGSENLWKGIRLLSRNNSIANLIQTTYFSLFNYPKTLQIHINSECNLDCTYCYSKKGRSKFSFEKASNLVRDGKRMGIKFVDILGGEPFLYKRLFRLVNYINNLGMRTTIFTNGTLINSDSINKMKKYGNKLALVIKYDYDSTTYQKHTNQGDKFKSVQETIQDCTNQGIPVITFTVLTKHNVKHIREIINNSIKLGAFPVFERVMPSEEGIIQGMQISKTDWETALEYLTKAYQNYSNVIEGICYLKRGACSCFADNLSIDQEGNVLPCPLSPVELSLGNINNKSLDEIYSGNKNMRKRWFEIPEDCRDCKIKYLCGGGCKVAGYVNNDKNLKQDPFCNHKYILTLPHVAFPLIRLLKNKNKIGKLNLV